ncbi:MAG: hypothetical protein ACTHLT_20570 [Devosia sp.]
MSLELAPDKYEIRDDATGGLILDHATRLAPVVQKLSLTNVDVAFPDVSKATHSIMNFGRKGFSSESPNGRSWRAYAWGLRIDAGVQSGSINLAAVGAGLSPNFILAKFRCFRSVNARDDVFGPFIKSMLENTWITGRAGRLEYNAWCRRIFWIDVEGGFVRLNWKQSSRTYNPNQLDPDWAWSWPERYTRLDVPPAYQIGSSYEEAPLNDSSTPGFPGGTTPPFEKAAPAWSAGPKGAFSFASTWRFTNLDIWLGQV